MISGYSPPGIFRKHVDRCATPPEGLRKHRISPQNTRQSLFAGGFLSIFYLPCRMCLSRFSQLLCVLCCFSCLQPRPCAQGTSACSLVSPRLFPKHWRYLPPLLLPPPSPHLCKRVFLSGRHTPLEKDSQIRIYRLRTAGDPPTGANSCFRTRFPEGVLQRIFAPEAHASEGLFCRCICCVFAFEGLFCRCICCVLISSAAASSLSKVCFVAVFAVPLSAAASTSSTASAASLALGKNRATTLAGWRTISLSKSTSLCCKTMFFLFLYLLSNWVHFRQPKNVFSPKDVCFLQKWLSRNWWSKKKMHDNRKMCSLQKQIPADPRPCTFCNQKMCPSPQMVVEKRKCAPIMIEEGFCFAPSLLGRKTFAKRWTKISRLSSRRLYLCR